MGGAATLFKDSRIQDRGFEVSWVGTATLFKDFRIQDRGFEVSWLGQLPGLRISGYRIGDSR